jgi:mobilome CxxCx(11)CxxC protein
MSQEDCHRKKCDSYGTAYIFENRARKYELMLNILTFLGFLGPLTIAGVVGSEVFNKKEILSWVLPAASLIGAIQLILSLWAIIAKWNEKYAHALNSSAANSILKSQFENLAQNFNSPGFKTKYQSLCESYNQQEQADLRFAPSEKEKRKGHRAALILYQMICAGCGKKPTSMEKAECHICGRF